MDWIITAATFLGGGIVGYFIDWLIKRGNVVLDQTHLKIFYRSDNAIYYLDSLELDLQFINKSGYHKLIHDLKTEYFVDEDSISLLIDGYNYIAPAEVIEPRKVKRLQFKMKPQDVVEFDFGIIGDKAYLQLTYNIGKHVHEINIKAWNSELIDITFRPLVA